jgi:hypothetical protein
MLEKEEKWTSYKEIIEFIFFTVIKKIEFLSSLYEINVQYDYLKIIISSVYLNEHRIVGINI